MDWLSASEIAFGLVLKGTIVAKYIVPSNMAYPYDKAIKLLAAGKDVNDVIDKVGLDPVMASKQAAEIVDVSLDWIAQLNKVAGREQLAASLEREVIKLRKGEDINVAKILAAVRENEDYGNRYTTLDKIEPSEGIWVPSYYPPQDQHIGGFPDGGLTIIGAPPGVGKTSLMLRYAIGAAKQGKQVLIYTLEMQSKQLLYRLLQLNKIPKEVRKFITVCDTILDMDEVYSDASRILNDQKHAFVSIDFADLLLSGEEDEQSVGKIYRRCSTLAKETATPVVLLSQLNRNYIGGIPRIHNIRWSGLAEAMGALILMLYNPNQIWIEGGKNDKQLDVIDGRGYIIQGKSRFGFKSGGVGAFQVDWDGETAWGETSYGWWPLHSVT